MVVGVEIRSNQDSIPHLFVDYNETFATVMNRTDAVCVRRFHDALNAIFNKNQRNDDIDAHMSKNTIQVISN